MNHRMAVDLAEETRRNWQVWNDLERGDAIVRLRKYGLSHRKLAKIARCSEGLIRHIEIVGRLPYYWKEYLWNGYSTRRVVAAWRAQFRR